MNMAIALGNKQLILSVVFTCFSPDARNGLKLFKAQPLLHPLHFKFLSKPCNLG